MAIRKTKHLPSKLLTKEELASLQPYMRSINNRPVYKSLFIEAISESVKDNMADIDNEGVKPIFTVKDHDYEKDGIVYYSLKNIYFSYDHIPGFEYEFAKDVFNSWDHWVGLCNSSMKELIAGWRDEYTVMIQAKAFKALAKTAYYDGAKGTPAARFLADRGWEVKRGRPSKEEVERVKKVEAGLEREVADDIERMGLTLVKTGK